MKDETEIRAAAIRFILPPSSFILEFSASYGSRTRAYASTGRHACRYTNKASVVIPINSGRPGESNPRHDIHSVGCCHYTKVAVRQAEEEGVEPSPPVYGAATFSKRVRRRRYSPLFRKGRVKT
jgi:hypothetical protein